MSFEPGGWTLSMNRLEAAITPKTRAICVNSPANPTGWTASREELAAILGLSASMGSGSSRMRSMAALSMTARPARPSFHDVMEAEDRILFVQTMSKNWAMTVAGGLAGSRRRRSSVRRSRTSSSTPPPARRCSSSAEPWRPSNRAKLSSRAGREMPPQPEGAGGPLTATTRHESPRPLGVLSVLCAGRHHRCPQGRNPHCR